MALPRILCLQSPRVNCNEVFGYCQTKLMFVTCFVVAACSDLDENCAVRGYYAANFLSDVSGQSIGSIVKGQESFGWDL